MLIRDMEKIGAKLREARERKGLTQETLAEYVDLSFTYVGMVERGERTPSLGTLLGLLDVLEITPDEVLCDV